MSLHRTGARSPAIVRFLTRAPTALSQRLWIWPLIGAVVLTLVGLWVHGQVERTTRAELQSRLQTLLQAHVATVRLWFAEQESDAVGFAADTRVQEAIVELTEVARGSNATVAVLARSAAAVSLQARLMPALKAQQYMDYVVIGADRRILASPRRQLLLRKAPAPYKMFLDKALTGEPSISRPFTGEPSPNERSEGPTMFVAAPLKSADGKTVAVLALRMKPEEEFTRVFSIARMGETGEAYAFDQSGLMLSGSRFEPELKQMGLLPNTPEASAILTLRLLDPEANLERGEGRKKARKDLRLTKMADSATRGHSGYDVVGYRNYRGVQVVGAWSWLPSLRMGVATEVTADEAFKTLKVLRQAFLVLFGLLVLSGAGLFAFTLVVERLQRSVRRSAVAARRLGQYVLVQEIGRGANGMVYRARHALLRRPVAIKLLDPALSDASNTARFEQEVQMTSQLTHPNTVAVYDYGRTPEGVFYYAMEFLSGIDLDRLVRSFGPQPEGRVISILRQICGSLAEAHNIKLIHRDIKPANVVLTKRGGVCDLVKVLDFGLVKNHQKDSSDQDIVGTPHFMSPEAAQEPAAVNAQSDIYSLGAVGFWLVAGKTLFDSAKVEVLLEAQIHAAPPRPSERLGRKISSDLEDLIMACLSKSPSQRPATAAALDAALAKCTSAGAWTSAQAEEWWSVNLPGIEVPPPVTTAEKTLVIAARP